ncbi:MAG TPA: TonB-dependent receptor [Steroidobacteraceae bacterium]|nr:TonB-dependent receptor [Steroidobacteraceae bacterium]
MKYGVLRQMSAAISMVCALAFVPAQAQESSAPSQTAASEAPALSEIVVTALKRSQSVQEVPASISAVSGDSLAQMGLSDLRDISHVVPNLNWGEHFGTTLITIRGAGSNVDSGATEPTVALYVDGIYLPRSDMATFRAVDLDRVEVLRGPQGTLYGRNAAGGAVNFVSQEPTRELSGKMELSTGERDAFGVSGYVSGPISPIVSVRLSGGHEQQHGYLTVLNTGQQLNGVATNYGRLAVAIEPENSNIRNVSSIRYEKNTAPVAYQQPLAAMVFPAATYTTKANEMLADGPFSGRRATFIASNALTWEVSQLLTVKSLTGYIDHNSHAGVDDDGSLVPLENTPDFVRTSKAFSQELNFIGQAGKLDWILGLFYFNERYFGNLPVTLGAAGAAPPIPIGSTINLGQRARIHNAAAFADVNYKLSDRVTLNLGLRYNHEDNDYEEIYSFAPIVAPISGKLPKSANKLLPKVALKVDLAPDVHSYVQWSVGYKSGGVNLPSGSGEILPLYQPERISAFEAGIKSQFLDRTLTFNAAVWYYDYKDLQITQDIPPATTVVRNANAKIYGVEQELRWNPIRNLDIHIAPTWQHAVFDKFVTYDPLVGRNIDLDGSQLPRAPQFTVNGGIADTFALGGGFLSSLRLEANAVTSSSVVLRYENQNPDERQKAYTVANFSATLGSADDKTQLTVFLNNAFDTVYKQNVTNFGIGYMGNYGPPRTWGLKVSRRL